MNRSIYYPSPDKVTSNKMSLNQSGFITLTKDLMNIGFQSMRSNMDVINNATLLKRNCSHFVCKNTYCFPLARQMPTASRVSH